MSADRELRAAGPLLVAAGIAVVASVAVTAESWNEQTGKDLGAIPLVFALFIAVGEVLRITLPGSRQSAPLAVGGCDRVRACCRRSPASHRCTTSGRSS